MRPEYLAKIATVDVDDPKAVVDCIKDYINDDKLAPEQKLYAFGLLVNKNKDSFIVSLQMKNENMRKVIRTYEKIIADLKSNSSTKKKVVVVKKKTI